MRYRKQISNAFIVAVAVFTTFMPTTSTLAQVYDWEYDWETEENAPIDLREPLNINIDTQLPEYDLQTVEIEGEREYNENPDIENLSEGISDEMEGQQEHVPDELFEVVDAYNDIATLPDGRKVLRSYSGARLLYEEEGKLKVRGDNWREFYEKEESRLNNDYYEGYYYEVPFEQENISIKAGSLERNEHGIEIFPENSGFERITQRLGVISNYYNVYPDVDVRFIDRHDDRQREIVINKEPENLSQEENLIFWEHYSLPEDARVITSNGEAIYGENELDKGVGLFIYFNNGDVFEISGAKAYDSASLDDLYKNISAVGLEEIVRVDRELGELSVGIKMPASYLQDNDRVYPVIIDPYYYACKSSGNSLGCNATYAELKWADSQESNDSIMYTGYHYVTSHHPKPWGPAERQIVIRFNNLNFPNNYKVTQGYLNLYYNGPGYNDGKSSYLQARKIKKYWSQYSVTHKKLMYSVSDVGSALYSYPGMSKSWKSWNVVSAVKDWQGNPSSNYGILVSPNPKWTTATDPSWPNSLYGFRSSKYSSSSYRPYLQVYLESTGQPDLTYSSAKINKTSFTPGEEIKINLDVKNIGTGSSYNKSYLYYYLKKGSRVYSNSYKIGQDVYYNLSPGGTSGESFNYTIPSNLSPGTYYVYGWVDATNTVIESNGGNNKFYWTITVNDAKPNLTSAGGHWLNKSTYKPGETITFKHDVWNYGTKNTGNFYIRYFLRKNNVTYSDSYSIGSQSANISSGSKKTFTRNFKLSNSLSSGKYYLSYYIDKYDGKQNGLVVESNENDNTDYTSLNIQADPKKPDLYAESCYPGVNSAKIDSTVTMKCTIWNNGGATAPANYLGYYLSKDGSWSKDDVLIGSKYYPSMSKGTNEYVQKDIIIPNYITPGDYTLVFFADYKEQVDEKKENNNIKYKSFTVLPKSSPVDLVADSLQILGANVAYPTGKKMTMQAKISNTGTDDVNNIDVKLRLKDKKTGLYYAINDLSPTKANVKGKNYSYVMLYGSLANTCDVPLSADYEAYLTVDSTKSINETNENNNEVSSGSNNSVKIQRLEYCVDKKQDYDGDGAYDADEKFMGTDPMKKDSQPSYDSNFDNYFSTPGDYSQGNFGADPVNLRTGALEFRQTDFTLNGRGVPIEFTRTYNSKNVERTGRLGNGWSSSYKQYYYQDPATKRVQLHLGGSLTVMFDTKDGGKTFVAPRAETGSLYLDNGVFVYKNLSGTQYRFGKTLSERLGMLTEIVDTFGNKTVLGYTNIHEVPMLTSVTDASGRSLKLSYSLQNYLGEWDKIRKIEETFAGNLSKVANYYYDNNGNLIKVSTNRIYNGKTEWAHRTFTYNGGRMDTYTDPRGGKLYNVYDGNGRVIEQYEQNPDKETGDQKHLIFKLSYSGPYSKAPGSKNCTSVRTYTTDSAFNNDISCFDGKGQKIYREDGEGKAEKWGYHENGLVNSYINQNGQKTLFNYDGLNRLVTIIYPDTADYNNEMHYSYENNFSQLTKEVEKSIDKKTNKVVLERIMSHEIDPKTGLTLSSTDPYGKKETYTYDSFGNKLSYTDKLGHKTTYKYDPLGNYLIQQSEIAKQPDGSSKTVSLNFAYDAHGNKSKRTTQRGNVYQFNYDSNGNLRKSTDPYNKVKTYEYDVSGNLTSETSELGRKTTYTYDKGIQEYLVKTEVQGDNGAVIQKYEYDAAGRLIKETDPLGRNVSYVYDKANRVLSKAFPYYTASYVYDGIGNLVQETTNAGHKIKYKYDERNNLIEEQSFLDSSNFVYNKKKYDGFGRVVKVTNANGYSSVKEVDLMDRVISVTNPLGEKTSYTYDLMGRKIGELYPRAQSDQSLRNSNGHSISYQYDGLGRLLKQIDADNKITSFFHDEDGKVVKRIERHNADGSKNTRTIQYVYDKLGRVISETNPEGKIKSFTYDDVGNVLTTKDEVGRVMTFTYDKLNNLVKEKDPTGAVATYKYDKVGNRISSTNAENKITTFTYDNQDRLKTVKDANGKIQEFGYGIFGNRTSYKDQSGNTTSYVYDKLGRITSETNSQGTKTAYTYDKAGRRLSQDVAGKKTTYVFDKFGRLKSTTNPSGAIESFSYDADGNIVEEVDGNGNKITYKINAINQVEKKTYSDNTTNTFVYNNWGDLFSVKDDLGTIEYVYTNKGQKLSEKRTFSDLSKSYTTSYTYHNDGNIASVTDPANKKVDYTYDGRGLLKAVAYGGKNLASYTYSSAGRATKITYGNGVTNNISYNELQRMSGFTIKDSAGKSLFGRSYSYDERGNTTKITENGNRVIEYGFDKLSQITSEKITNGADVNEFKFVYDKWGNRTSLTSPHEKTSYKYTSGNDQLKNADYNNRLLVDTTYDKNGNITNEKYTRLGNKMRDVTYTWNNRNKLSSIEYSDSSRPSFMPALPKNKLSFVYDYAGNRAKKTSNGNSKYYINRGVVVQNEIDSTGEVTMSLVQGLDAVARIKKNGSIEYLHQDPVRSTVLSTDKDGKVIKEFEYTAFGEVAGATDDYNYLFTGQEYDFESDLHYYNARYYSPRLGRFLSRDAVRGNNGDVLSKNPYIYVRNNPLKYIDPTGNEKEYAGGMSYSSASAPGQMSFVSESAYKDYLSSLSDNELLQHINAMSVGTGMTTQIHASIPNLPGYKWSMKPHPKWIGKSTSVAHIYNELNKRKSVRLDYGYNTKTGVVDWHWNQKGVSAKFGGVIDHTPANKPVKIGGKGMKILGAAGKPLLVLGVAVDGYSIYNAEDKVEASAEVAGGWAGAYGGAKVGAGLAALICSETGPGAVICGAVGGIGGGIAGYYMGSEATDYMYEKKDVIVDIASDTYGYVKDGVVEAATDISNIATEIGGYISDTAVDVGNYIADTAVSIGNTIADTASDVSNYVSDKVSDAWEGTKDFFSGWW